MDIPKKLVRDIDKELAIEAPHQKCNLCGRDRTPVRYPRDEYLGVRQWGEITWVCVNPKCSLKINIDGVSRWKKDFPKKEVLVNVIKTKPRTK